MKPQTCELKGFLSFHLLWMVHKGLATGAELTAELEKRRGSRPSPGTIYPALKELVQKGLLRVNAQKKYSLTSKGKAELEEGLRMFCTLFSDFEEMKGGCCQ